MSSGAFSGKKKKALLQAKRKTQRERAEGAAAPPQPEQRAPAAEAGAGARPRLKTVLAREDEADVQRGRLDATRPLELTQAARDGLLPAWPDALQPPVSMPLRPQWTYEDSAAALEAREAAAFAAWDAQLQAAHASQGLSRYERNLRVWAQLWRTLEVSDALLLVVDARTPLISFPAPLYEAAASRGMPLVVLLNKADLLPEDTVEAWCAHLRQRFPRLTAVIPFRADPGAAPKGFKRGQRKTGYSRWRAGGEPVRNDVDALLRAVKALPVTRHGMQRTFGDFWSTAHEAAAADEAAEAGGSGGGGDAAAAVPPASSASSASDEEEEEEEEEQEGGGARAAAGDAARAAAALAQSEGWAAQHSDAAGHAQHSDAARMLQLYVTLGVVGEPNQGKSAVINRLFRAPVVKASPTPGCTKHLQTLHLQPLVRLADCPGLVFPKVGVPLGMQLLCGNTPIAQAREPFSTIRYLAEAGVHPPLQAAYGLSVNDAAEHSCTTAGAWSPYALCEALAVKRSFLTRGGRPDVFRAANRVLRDALAGKNIRLAFVPPGMPPRAWAEPAEEGMPAGDGQTEEQGAAAASDGDASSSEADEDEERAAAANPFAALGEEE
jgi:ribosome biogenesis GTPase A